MSNPFRAIGDWLWERRAARRYERTFGRRFRARIGQPPTDYEQSVIEARRARMRHDDD